MAVSPTSGVELKAFDGESQPAETDLMNKIILVNVGSTVTHKMFGKGKVTKLDNAKKYLRVRFDVGEKNFLFPGAFIDGFLSLD